MEPSKKDYTFRQYCPGDEDKIVKLLVDVFQPWPKFNIECSPVDYWKWKYIDNPAYKDMYPHTVAENNGEIIGVDHGMLFYIKIGEGKYLSHKGTDTAVNLSYRGQGVYSKINKLKHVILREIGYEFDYALSNNPILVELQQRLRATRDPEAETPFPQPPKSLIKIKDINKYFKNVVNEKDQLRKTYLKMGVYGSKILNKLTNLNPKPQKTSVEIREITKFDDRINTFYEKVKPHYLFIVERTKDYMNWRYCDKRGGNYKVWIAKVNDEIWGYLVLKINKINPDHPEGYLIDLLALNEREDVADNLTKFAIDYFDEKELNVVLAQVVGGHPYERILDKYGLLNTRTKSNLHWRFIKPSDDFDKFADATPAMLHYTFGEGDAL